MKIQAVEIDGKQELSRHEMFRRATRLPKLVRTPTITCEAQLISGENIGTKTRARRTARSSNNATSTFSSPPSPTTSGDDDDGGGDDPDPERKPRSHNKKPFAGLPDEGYVRLKQVLEIFPVSKSTWWNGVREGRFPRAIKLGPRTTAWDVSDIRKLIEQARNA